MIGIFLSVIIFLIAFSASRLYWAAANCFLGLATSKRWWGILAISFLVILPAPISIPLYTCRESAEIISPWNFRASLTANALFPEAVAPAMTIIFAMELSTISICVDFHFILEF